MTAGEQLMAHAVEMGGWLTAIGLTDDEHETAEQLCQVGWFDYVDDGIPRYALTEIGVAVTSQEVA